MHACRSTLEDPTELSLQTSPERTKLSGRTTLRNRTLVALEGDTPLSLKHVLAKAPLPDLPLAVGVHAPALDLADFTVLSDKLEGYGGVARLEAKLGGTLRHPKAEAQLGIAGAHVDQIEFGPMTFHARLDDRQLTADFSTVPVEGGGLQARAVVQRVPGYPLDVRFESHDVDITFARALTPGLRELGGKLSASLHVTGPAKEPVLTGNLSLDKGTVGVVGEPTWHDVSAQFAMTPGKIDVQKIHMRSGNGRFDAHGQVLLAGTVIQKVSLQASADDFNVAMAGTGNASLRGQFAIEAAQRQDVLAGKVEIPNARLWLPKMLSGGKKLPKTVQPPDLIYVDRAGIKAERKKAEKQNVSGKQRQEIDIAAKLGTLYVQSKDMNLEITADTALKTGPTGQPAISGGVSIRRGHIMIKDQRFEFDRAEIMFDGSEEINPGLDIQLSHEYPEVTAIVEVHGTLKHPELRFTSDPPIYDQSGVIGLIMTGGAVGGDPSASQFNAEAAVTNALLGVLADDIAPALGLDVLRVGAQAPDENATAQGDTDTRVEVGKYLSPRVYLSFVHVFGAPENDNTNEAHVEYRMTRRWVMETAFGDAGVGGIDFLWTYRY